MYNKSIRSLTKYFTNVKNYDNNTPTDIFEDTLGAFIKHRYNYVLTV